VCEQGSSEWATLALRWDQGSSLFITTYIGWSFTVIPKISCYK
jgi:hypothetical protein